MAITIGWGSQQSWQRYDSRGRDHRWSTDAAYLDKQQGCQLVIIMLERNRGLPSGTIGSHLEEAETRNDTRLA
jgi:hypothetical protein